MNRRELILSLAGAPLVAALPAIVEAEERPGLWRPSASEVMAWHYYFPYYQEPPASGRVVLRPERDVEATGIHLDSRSGFHMIGSEAVVRMPWRAWPVLALRPGDEVTMHWMLGAEIPFSIEARRPVEFVEGCPYEISRSWRA